MQNISGEKIQNSDFKTCDYINTTIYNMMSIFWPSRWYSKIDSCLIIFRLKITKMYTNLYDL